MLGMTSRLTLRISWRNEAAEALPFWIKDEAPKYSELIFLVNTDCLITCSENLHDNQLYEIIHIFNISVTLSACD